jgi:hypothetical protein
MVYLGSIILPSSPIQGKLGNCRSEARLRPSLGLLLSLFAIGLQIASPTIATAETTDEPQDNEVVSAFDIHANLYKYENKLLWLNPEAVTEIVNGMVAKYSQGSVARPQSEKQSYARLELPKQTGQEQKTHGIPATTKSVPGCQAVNTKSDFRGRVVIHEGYKTWTALHFERPTCIDGSTLEEIEILDDSYGAVFQSLKNTPVKVTGTLVSGEGSPHYMTFYALYAQSIHTTAGNTIVPKAPRPTTIPREITRYHARVSTLARACSL